MLSRVSRVQSFALRTNPCVTILVSLIKDLFTNIRALASARGSVARRAQRKKATRGPEGPESG